MAGGATLDHLFIVVTDLDRSKRFYADVLGLEVTLEGEGYVQVRGLHPTGSARIGAPRRGRRAS
jgi:catechol 2,3-dioxygenase-like lactoylglutathione lyase family enzyme